MEEVQFDAEFMTDPFALYARLRSAAPVRRVTTPEGLRVWLITRHEDVRTVLTDPRLSKDLNAAGDLYRRHTEPDRTERKVSPTVSRHMLASDPPVHTRLRKLVSRAFAVRPAETMRPKTERISAELLDGLAGRTELDLIGEYAFPMAITVICELLGLPAAEQHDFQKWTQEYNSSGSSAVVNAASHRIAGYLVDLLARKREEPADDLLTALIEARDQDDRLSDDELVSMVFLLLSAGHETTVNLISNGLLALLRNPGQLALLRREPALLGPAVEELLRYDGPVNTATLRFTTEPVRVGGTEIPPGEFVLASVASANRDDDQFPDPDRLDIARADNHHSAFGHGIHYCLGAALARQEATVAFHQLLARYPAIELAVPVTELRYRHSLLMRGLEALPLRVTG